MSAEYIMAGGNNNVILCERGIRTFETKTRNTLDLAAVPMLKKLSHLPVVIDPSHATGISWMVEPLAKAAIAVGADGLMLLDSSQTHSFSMKYFNSDGSGGMMCGNGGRCIAAFAADMGINTFDFEAPDGMHAAEVGDCEQGVRIVRLLMKNACAPVRYDALDDVDVPSDGWYADTGTFHFVRKVQELDAYDVTGEGRSIRYSAAFAPIGTNVNFVEPVEGGIKVRTYEKGVEDEANACGTGVVASALSAYVGNIGSFSNNEGRISYEVWTKRDLLKVDFRCPEDGSDLFEDIWLTGPATFVAEVYLPDMNII